MTGVREREDHDLLAPGFIEARGPRRHTAPRTSRAVWPRAPGSSACRVWRAGRHGRAGSVHARVSGGAAGLAEPGGAGGLHGLLVLRLSELVARTGRSEARLTG